MEIVKDKYIILAKGGHKGFTEPRQLTKINGERILDRTIRLLKENGIKDIIVTGNYTDIDAKVIDPEGNTYEYDTDKGYWLDAFKGIIGNYTYIWGDVYFTDEAIKTIVETKVKENTLFCTDEKVKGWNEPLAYKIVNKDKFEKSIETCKRMYDNGKAKRNPIIWEVYRIENGININKHILKDNVIMINDETTDIDSPRDIAKLKYKIGECKMVRVKATTLFTYSNFDKVKELIRANAQSNEKGTIYVGDIFLVDNNEAKYLTETAEWCKHNGALVEIIEVIPEEKKEPKKTPVKKATNKTTKK